MCGECGRRSPMLRLLRDRAQWKRDLLWCTDPDWSRRRYHGCDGFRDHGNDAVDERSVCDVPGGKSIFRFGFRYVSTQSDFVEYRNRIGKPDIEDLDTFIGMIAEQLSGSALKVLARAKDRYQRYRALVGRVARVAGRSKRFQNPKRRADSEAAIIKGIIEFELSQNRASDWTFTDGGLGQLNADFLLVNEYLNIYDSADLKRLCDRFGVFFLEMPKTRRS